MLDKGLIQEAAQARAAIINDGAAAARAGRHRTENPFEPGCEHWMVWRDGFEEQMCWLVLGRGDYHVSAQTALVP